MKVIAVIMLGICMLSVFAGVLDKNIASAVWAFNCGAWVVMYIKKEAWT